jgi:hypothetical protein
LSERGRDVSRVSREDFKVLGRGFFFNLRVERVFDFFLRADWDCEWLWGVRVINKIRTKRKVCFIEDATF